MIRTSLDTLWNGRIRLWQPARGCGYRFNLDPVLLAGFVPPAAHILDLGAGCGIVGIVLLKLGKAKRVTAVEVQPELAAAARRNAEENDLSHCLDVIEGDLRGLELPTVDGVCFNPPYHRNGLGRPAPNSGRDAGRHERHGTLADFVGAASRSASSEGPISAIVPTERQPELEGLCARMGRYRVRRRHVHARRDTTAGFVLVEARPGRETAHAELPLIVHAGAGREFTEEVQCLVTGPA